MNRRRRLQTPRRRHGAALALPAWAQADSRIVLGPVGRLQRTGRAARHPDEQRRASSTSTRSTPAGGINGAQIELRTLDDGYEPDRCKANTEQASSRTTCSRCSAMSARRPAWPRCRWSTTAKIPFFGPFTGAEALRDPFSRYVFHVRASYYDETALIVKQLTALEPEEDRGLLPERQLRQGRPRRREARAEGAATSSRWRSARSSATRSTWRRRVQDDRAQAPDAVVQISAYKSCAAFIREARKAGYGGTLLQRVVRRHAGAGRRARQGGPRHHDQPGDAVPVRRHDADLARVPRGGAARPAATPSPTTRAWKATWPPRCSPRA